MSDRGVSNLLGYTLMFGIIITATVGVSFLAFGQLETVRDGEQLSNAERGFTIIGQNIDEIETSRAAVRRGAIDLNDGQLGLTSGADSAIFVQVLDSGGDSDDNYRERIPLRALRYRLGDSTLAYESGAVFRRDDGAGVMQSEPRFHCTDDTALVSVVTLRGDTATEIGGGTVSIRTSERDSRVLFPINDSGENSTEGRSDVTVDVGDTQFSDAWVQYLEDSEWERVSSSPSSPSSSESFRCEDVDSYYVRQSVVDVSYSR